MAAQRKPIPSVGASLRPTPSAIYNPAFNIPSWINPALTSAAYMCPSRRGSRHDQHGKNPGDRICSFIERVEHIDEEIKALNEGKKEVFSEAKGEGFDVKVLREILRLRKQDKEDRDEQDTLLDLYLRAMESAGSSQAKAA